ncbi:MAG: helix-turn-helix transcriptional regulator [Candidatus Pacebacteria bacterium]|nr:helix-turn-helix transcriptional regulator [Candidatus Paceibacterota bacterium]PIR63420.1 MAG: transcriptional regulator [Candidatus Pacebacteria bacterium CG10_big_fil_rev_8_21_14_0_10_40_26]PIZ79557.1 MAG: transcriptional regulator [Candidatus Pacebacteria bacterium CG_4_10_14_0_2_um_filter_40_20]PJA69010.1 MAG: transcriptional regulator [Candidatus Pacebacteria bacterium CG_4_9_14_3_um_filter_40_12]PJC41857.1 MAG: transcriptional regulator [Candidatus Pacebacteria bacterium CG_4_9_14_0_2
MEEKQKVTELVGDEIRKHREESGLSQEELSAKAGLYRTYVGHVEVGRYTPSIYTLFKIARALKVKVSEIIPF